MGDGVFGNATGVSSNDGGVRGCAILPQGAFRVGGYAGCFGPPTAELLDDDGGGEGGGGGGGGTRTAPPPNSDGVRNPATDPLGCRHGGAAVDRDFDVVTSFFGSTSRMARCDSAIVASRARCASSAFLSLSSAANASSAPLARAFASTKSECMRSTRRSISSQLGVLSMTSAATNAQTTSGASAKMADKATIEPRNARVQTNEH